MHVIDNSIPEMPTNFLISRHGGASDFDEMNFKFQCLAVYKLDNVNCIIKSKGLLLSFSSYPKYLFRLILSSIKWTVDMNK